MIDFIGQKTKAIAMNKAANYALIAFIFLAAICYIYFANMTVRTLTVLEKTKRDNQSLSVEVSEMESKRLSIENSVNTEKAIHLGFMEMNNPTFIMKNSKKTALSLKMN